MIAFCVEREAGLLVVGDITEMPRNARKNKRGSRRINQENSGNPLGQLYQYLEYKGKLNGVRIEKINEAYTSQQSPCCPSRYKPRGRTYQCRSCGMTYVRDEVGATNILNKYLGGGKMSVGTLIPTNQVKYLRPVKLRQSVVAPMTEGMLNSATLNSELALSGVGVHTPPVQSFVA